MKTMAQASAPRASNSRAAACTAATSTGVWIVPSASVRSGTSSRMSRSATGTKSPQRPQVCGRSRRRISSTSRKPAVVMTPSLRALAFQQRVGADRRTVDDRLEAGRAAKRAQAVHETHRLVAAVGRHLGGAERVGAGVEEEQVGEGAADIDADEGIARHALYP